MNELKENIDLYCKENNIINPVDALRCEKGIIEFAILGADDNLYWFNKAQLPKCLEKIVDGYKKLGG